jgi:hypothetical protein
MKVQVFIPDWPGPKQHAGELAEIISRRYNPVNILADPDDFFNAKWEKARQGFTGDILLWIMADVTLPKNFEKMCDEMERFMACGNVGWYAPDIAWTSYIYNKKDLREIEPEVYEVPNTDSLCFAIRGDVVRAMPYVNPKLSFMWGMDLTAIAMTRLFGLKVVRDYRFKAGHPNNTGYDIDKAGKGMIPLFQTYPWGLQNEIFNLENEVRRLRMDP